MKDHLLRKVTRERFGLEIDKMFKSVGSPVDSFRHLCDFGLYSVIFALPPVFEPEQPGGPLPFFPVPLRELALAELTDASLSVMAAAYAMLEGAPNGHGGVLGADSISATDRKHVLLAAFFSPLFGYAYKLDKKRATCGLPFFVLRNALRLPLATAEGVMELLMGAQMFLECSRMWVQLHLAEQAAAHPHPTLADVAAAEALAAAAARKSGKGGAAAASAPAAAAVAVPVAVAATGVEFCPAEVFAATPVVGVALQVVPPELRRTLGHTLRATGPQWPLALALSDVFVRHFHAFVIARFLPSQLMVPWLVNESGLIGCWTWRPVFDGRTLMAEFGVAGPRVGEVQAAQMDWLLENPGCAKEDLFLFLQHFCNGGGGHG